MVHGTYSIGDKGKLFNRGDMLNEIKIFENQEFGSIRTIEVDGMIYFIGKDVCDSLGYSNSRDALSKHVETEDKNTVAFHDGKGNPNMTAINESGLYSLIFSSKLESAKKFKHWVTSEVLPTIRKTGIYEQSRKLVFYEPIQIPNSKRVTIRVSSSAYMELDEIANRSGLSIREVADKMIHFAYQNTEMKPID